MTLKVRTTGVAGPLPVRLSLAVMVVVAEPWKLSGNTWLRLTARPVAVLPAAVPVAGAVPSPQSTR